MGRNDMGKVLYTIGYGNMKPDDFVAKLKAAGVTVVLDVRRKGSRSWNGKYRRGSCMASLLYGYLDNESPDIGYGLWGAFGNDFDSLPAYNDWLLSRRSAEISLLAERIVDDSEGRYCLLCAEGDPFENDGMTPRCHRVYVAEALVERLGAGWTIEHL